jgi:hypothetical protein
VGQRWTAEERAFYFAVHNLLLREWDPIGVADVPEARNEYSAYDAQVFQLLRAGSSARQVATFLAAVEVEQMGLEPRPDHIDRLTDTVAAKLVALPVPPKRAG